MNGKEKADYVDDFLRSVAQFLSDPLIFPWAVNLGPGFHYYGQ